MDKNKWNFRGKLSLDSWNKVKKVQAEQVLAGNPMTQAEVLDFIIKHFQNKKS